MEQPPVKNTFIHYNLPPTDSHSSWTADAQAPMKAPPTVSAPSQLLDHSFHVVRPAVRPQRVVVHNEVTQKGPLVRLLSRFGGFQYQNGVESPVAVQSKNTFVHFDRPASPVSGSRPPTKSAPEAAGGRLIYAVSLSTSPGTSPNRSVFVVPTDSHASSIPGPSCISIPNTASSGRSPTDYPYPGGQLNFLPLAPSGLMPADGQAAAAAALACQQQPGAGAASLGSEGHESGNCIPCLMEVRWRAGKCAEPCRFGQLCGRCHEAHTEEELQKVQARMRKEKKKHGAAGAALLSAAFVHGRAAPIGAGVVRAPPAF
mmetsp:Transcript_174522/g.559515  ORF Transcript_174522/g.559515 Transcript_174522/m.559515 type:complete len:315 (-) Transcript_174522:32-976(-)